MNQKAPAIGIDLGTTYSCIAYVDEADRAVVIKNSEGDSTTPSVVMFEGGNVIVGKVAKEGAVSNPSGVVSFAKRYMGKLDESGPRTGLAHRFELETGSYSPEEISASILRKLAADGSQMLGTTIKDVVITVPAYFGVNEREATKAAGEIAGLNVLGIVPEPIAAAYAYGDVSTEKNVLVYDLGGGTFDVSIIKFLPTTYKTIVVSGDNELGGKDWDERIIRHLVARFAEATGTDASEIEDDPQTMADLQDLAERVVKKTLTSRDTAKVNVSHAGVRETITVTLEEFDQMTADLVVRTIDLTKAAIQQATDKGVANIDEILLVGGSSKMKRISAAVEEAFGKVPRLHDPDEAVAKGAAIVARNESLLREITKLIGEVPADVEALTPTEKQQLEKVAEERGTDVMGLLGSVNKTFETVCSKSFGIVSLEMPARVEKVFNLIICNTDLPASYERSFFTIDEGQTSVDVRIMENTALDKKAEVHESKELGKGCLEFGRAMPAETPIEVKFTMKADGTLLIEAEEKTTGRRLDVTIETPNVINGEELKKAKERSAALRF